MPRRRGKKLRLIIVGLLQLRTTKFYYKHNFGPHKKKRIVLKKKHSIKKMCKEKWQKKGKEIEKQKKSKNTMFSTIKKQMKR